MEKEVTKRNVTIIGRWVRLWGVAEIEIILSCQRKEIMLW